MDREEGGTMLLRSVKTLEGACILTGDVRVDACVDGVQTRLLRVSRVSPTTL